MKFPSKAQLERLRRKYPVGTVVELISMEDYQAPLVGTMGEVFGVDDAGSVLVKWQTGSTLSLIPEVDEFRIITKGDGQP